MQGGDEAPTSKEAAPHGNEDSLDEEGGGKRAEEGLFKQMKAPNRRRPSGHATRHSGHPGRPHPDTQKVDFHTAFPDVAVGFPVSVSGSAGGTRY